MSSRDGRAAAWVGLAAMVATACASHTAPEDFLSTPREAQVEARGAWVDVTSGDPAEPRAVAGELLAVRADSLWVLESSGTTALATAEVIEGQLVAWDSRYGRVALAVVGGTLSTVSNGFALVITAPLWILFGTGAAARQSREPIEELPPPSWEALSRFARFPQGLPEGAALDPPESPPGRSSSPPGG